MIIFAALVGALIATGFVFFAAELTRRAPAPGTPPRLSPLSSRLSLAAIRRGAPALGVALAMLLVTGWPVAALAGGVAVIFLPRITGNRAAKRHTAMLEGLEQWVRRLADMLTASRGLQDALEASAKSAPDAVAAPVTALARRLSARVGTEEALRAFANEIDDPAGDRIAAALIIATGQRGGGVRGVLTALAEMLARDVAARREIEADRAQHRTTLRWIIVFVGGFTLFAILNKSYSAPYGTLAGEGVLAVVALLYTGGLTWLHRLGMIPGPGRFLDGAAIRPEDAGPRPDEARRADARRQVGSDYASARYRDAGYTTGGGP
jgi:Flp pilus assembly protein TadB